MTILTDQPMPAAAAPVLSPPSVPVIPIPTPDEQQLLLENITWKQYLAFGEALADRPGLRMTYDRGRLEFMTLSLQHEGFLCLLRRLIAVLTEEMRLRVRGFGSMTNRREDIERGAEPDQCYYLTNLERMRGVQRLDLTRHPPPDLVIEIEVTRSALNRMEIFARLGVPELWRFDGENLFVYRRDDSGSYQQVERSPTFPAIAPAELVRFVQLGEAEDETAMVEAFRAWVREQLSRT